jgi:hypothetical protein
LRRNEYGRGGAWIGGSFVFGAAAPVAGIAAAANTVTAPTNRNAAERRRARTGVESIAAG